MFLPSPAYGYADQVRSECIDVSKLATAQYAMMLQLAAIGTRALLCGRPPYAFVRSILCDLFSYRDSQLILTKV